MPPKSKFKKEEVVAAAMERFEQYKVAMICLFLNRLV